MPARFIDASDASPAALYRHDVVEEVLRYRIGGIASVRRPRGRECFIEIPADQQSEREIRMQADVVGKLSMQLATDLETLRTVTEDEALVRHKGRRGGWGRVLGLERRCVQRTLTA